MWADAYCWKASYQISYNLKVSYNLKSKLTTPCRQWLMWETGATVGAQRKCKTKCSQAENQKKLCFAYKQKREKLKSRCEQGVFIGYNKNSPAWWVYYPDAEKVQKHRLEKFTTKTAKKKETQTSASYMCVIIGMNITGLMKVEKVFMKMRSAPNQGIQSDIAETLLEQTQQTQSGKVTCFIFILGNWEGCMGRQNNIICLQEKKKTGTTTRKRHWGKD